MTSYGPLSAVQWGCFEMIKINLYNIASSFSETKSTANVLSYQKSSFFGLQEVVNACSAGIAGLFAVTLTNPLEVLRIRTRIFFLIRAT